MDNATSEATGKAPRGNIALPAGDPGDAGAVSQACPASPAPPTEPAPAPLPAFLDGAERVDA